MKRKFREQWQKIPWYLKPGIMLIVAVALAVFAHGVQEQSPAVCLIGLFLLVFDGWCVLTY